MPRAKSGGVDGTLLVSRRPAPSTIAQSVKVPPMSMPTRYPIASGDLSRESPAPPRAVKHYLETLRAARGQPPARSGRRYLPASGHHVIASNRGCEVI